MIPPVYVKTPPSKRHTTLSCPAAASLKNLQILFTKAMQNNITPSIPTLMHAINHGMSFYILNCKESAQLVSLSLNIAVTFKLWALVEDIIIFKNLEKIQRGTLIFTLSEAMYAGEKNVVWEIFRKFERDLSYANQTKVLKFLKPTYKTTSLAFLALSPSTPKPPRTLFRSRSD